MEFIEHYKGVKKLGQGAFGKVYLAEHEITSEMVVIKVIDWSGLNADLKAKCLQECAVLKKLEHKNIVKYLHHFETRTDIGRTLGFSNSGNLGSSIPSTTEGSSDGTSGSYLGEDGDTRLCVVMEYAPLGDLDEYLAEVKKSMKTGGKPISEETIWKLFIQIIIAVGTLHHHHILHRDIKPANVLVSADGETIVADLGIASDNMTQAANQGQTFIGTPYFQSPEMFKGKTYGEKCDIWAIGVLLYEMMALEKPFVPKPANNFMGLCMKICNEAPPPLPAFAMEYSKELLELIPWMLQKSPKERPSALEIWTYACKYTCPEKLLASADGVNHPWTKDDLGKSLSDVIHAREGENKASCLRGISEIQRGRYSNVYMVEKITDKKPVIFKEILWSELSKDARNLIKLEIHALSKQKHPYILNHRSYFKTKENVRATLGFKDEARTSPDGTDFKSLCIIMPYAVAGDLASVSKHLKDNGQCFAEADLWRYLLQLIAAVGHMNNNGHHPSDVRPSNILLTEDKDIFLGDIVVSRMMIDTECKDLAVKAGKYDFYSPERLNGIVDEKSDVWSIGCTMYELANQRRAFHAETQKDFIELVNNGWPHRFSIKTTPISKMLRTCIKWMLQKDPSKRPNLNMIYSYIVQMPKELTGDFELADSCHNFQDIPLTFPVEDLLSWGDPKASPPHVSEKTEKIEKVAPALPAQTAG